MGKYEAHSFKCDKKSLKEAGTENIFEDAVMAKFSFIW